MKRGLLVIALLSVLFLSACIPGTPAPATLDVNALYTAAAETFSAELTRTAAAITPTAELNPASQITKTPTLTPGPVNTVTPIICDNSLWVADVTVPDNTELVAGQQFVKTWRVRNTGSCTWKTSYSIRWAYAEKMSGQTTALTVEIPASAEGEISITLKAPTTPGVHASWWRLFNNNGSPFGQFLGVLIVIK